MFDLVGSVDLAGRPPEERSRLSTCFSRTPWAPLAESQRHTVSGENFGVVSLRRLTDPQDYAVRGRRHVFLVGEAWLRWDCGPNDPSIGPRLSASELLNLLEKGKQDLVRSIKGNFVLVLLDENLPEVSIVTSRFAITPFYFFQCNGSLIFSTSIAEIHRLLSKAPDFDLTAVVETVLFNFPMHMRTFFKGISRASQGTILTFTNMGQTSDQYWDARSLYDRPIQEFDSSIRDGMSLLHKSVNLYACDQPRICASFTSGFDSRVIHALLDKDRNDILSYSFGRRGSENVEIPKRLCAEMGYPFLPVYLDDEYRSRFSEFAWQTIALSEGIVVQRANYPYAFSKVRDFSTTVLTGLFGSELLRTFQNLGTVVSEEFDRINRSEDHVKEASVILHELLGRTFLNSEIVRAAGSEVEFDVEKWFSWSGDFDVDKRIYLYLISEVDRKYFGTELSTERVYATTRFPFFDDEFVEFAFGAPFAGVHSRTIHPSVSTRFNSQKFYALAIKEYRPELLKYSTDHGYPPADILGPLAYVRVGSKSLFSRIRKRLTGYREFYPEDWLAPFFDESLFLRREDYGIIGAKFEQAYRSGLWKTELVQFDKLAALKLWLDTIA